MISTKQRAYLRSLAQKISPIFQVGKNGIEEAFLVQVEQALEKRELIKIKVLENSGLDTRETSDLLCDKIGCVGIQAIGNKIVLYKESKNKPQIELPGGKKINKDKKLSSAVNTRSNSSAKVRPNSKKFKRGK